MKKTLLSVLTFSALCAADYEIHLPKVPEYKRPSRPNVPEANHMSGKPAAADSAANKTCLSAEEQRLVENINNYRKSKGLPTLTATKSLTHVAQIHVKDLAENNPASGACNMHSWSARGTWSACCYTRDHAKASCMWKKPAELTAYQGNGYEISAMSSGGIDGVSALRIWQSSSGHNAVIINEGMWNRPWRAFGVGIYRGYAVSWFGHGDDAAGAAPLCK